MTDNPNQHALIDEPGRFATLETWETFLADLRKMPSFAQKSYLLQHAEKIVAEKRHAQSTAE